MPEKDALIREWLSGEVERLKKIIEDAPHSCGCKLTMQEPIRLKEDGTWEWAKAGTRPCDCFKSKV